MSKNKIIPSLWFSADGGSVSKIIEYYKIIFDKNFVAGNIKLLGNTTSGKIELCEVLIFEQKYSLMSTEKEHHLFNDAFALTINCDDQNEIDNYWDYFTQLGKEVQCGWCIDKYGLRWQVIPKNFDEILSKPKAWEVMMKQKKIIIAEY